MSHRKKCFPRKGHGPLLAVLTVVGCICASLLTDQPAGAANLDPQQRQALEALLENLQTLRARPESLDELNHLIRQEMARTETELAGARASIQKLTDDLRTTEQKEKLLAARLEALRVGEQLLTPRAPSTAPAAPPAASTPGDRGLQLFNQHVANLMINSCLHCHGGKFKKGGLDVSTREELLHGGDSGPAIVAGKAAESLLYQVITHEKEPHMPHKADKLPPEAISQIAEWINAGAPYARPLKAAADGKQAADAAEKTHWAFVAPAKPAVPAVRNSGWPRNPIDAFVLAPLENEGIAPSPEADRPALIRRLSIDLTGLPPKPQEVEAFVHDTAPDAYEKVVERLLASPHFGERWGRHWLDQARYADSDGYEKDLSRPHAWRYRNWVIDAFNRDLPFDQFTVEQLAGDLLPDGGIEARVATGFHRNTLTNREGGVDQEEYRCKNIVDRVSTTGTVWLGLTVGCAECHSHKYDPISQREFYGLFGFFNNADEADVPAPLTAAELAKFEQDMKAHRDKAAELEAAFRADEKNGLPGRQAQWEATVRVPSQIWHTLYPSFVSSMAGAALTADKDGIITATGSSPDKDVYVLTFYTDVPDITGIRLEVMPDDSLPNKGPGRAGNGNFVLSEFRVSTAPGPQPGGTAPIALSRAKADFEQQDYAIKGTIDGETANGKGWAILPQAGTAHSAIFETRSPVGSTAGTWLIISLEQQFGGQHTIGKFRLAVTTDPGPIEAAAFPRDVAGILKTPADKRTPADNQRLAEHYRSIDADHNRLKKAVDDHAKTSPELNVVKAQILAERTGDRRKTNVHLRGNFLDKGPEVSPATPAVLHPFKPRGTQPDRLDLAKWLMDPANPLTARVTVNRFWQYLFGQPLVNTPDDFGTRGELPSHPELLDWLAVEFRERGWSRKAMIRLIVGSATYRQSSNYREDLHDRDPKNVLLARQNRFRVEAEIARDINLAASGLLVTTIGGPSVFPPQPAGISELTYADSAKWVDSTGPDRYRRGLYTFFKRTSPYPMLMTFDQPDSNVTCTRRAVSNTPLQSLTLLNDPVFVECAQTLARKMSADMEGGPADRIRQAFQLCLSRPGTESEVNRLVTLFKDLRDLAGKNPADAARLAGQSDMPADRAVDLAAWVGVARTMLNLDEFMTRS